MIRVVRPAVEPPELKCVRDLELPRVAALPGAMGPLLTRRTSGRIGLPIHQPSALVPSKAIDAYQVARPLLFQAQHEKCCYCERYPEERWQDVEHFRPKSAYWWLAWTWSNLLFACKPCNAGSGKLTYFPLATKGTLQPSGASPFGQTPPGAERPLLRDPAEHDAMRDIQFQPDGHGGWRPYPRLGSRQGAEMIVACGLDRPTLRTCYRQVAIDLESELEGVRRALQAGVAADIEDAWERACRRQLRANAPFTALRHDILDHHFPPTLRKKHQLKLFIRHPDDPARPWP